MKYLFSLSLLLLTFNVIAQDSADYKELNPREENPFGINLVGGGPTILSSISVDYFVSPSINIEAGLGFGYYGGIKYHINGNCATNWTPYIGAFIARSTFLDIILDIFDEDDDGTGLYVPVGVQYTSDGGFTLGIELSYLSILGTSATYGSLRGGYHF